VLVVEDGVGDSRLSQERGEVGFPHSLGQPCAQGSLSEDRVHPIGKRSDLPDSVASRDADQHGLVIATRKKLDLTPPDEVREVADHVGTVRLKPIEERPREVEARFYLGMAVKSGNEGGIRPLGHILED
jgi:hypothetical protein